MGVVAGMVFWHTASRSTMGPEATELFKNLRRMQARLHRGRVSHKERRAPEGEVQIR